MEKWVEQKKKKEAVAALYEKYHIGWYMPTQHAHVS